MFAIDHPSAVPVRPAPLAAGAPGYFGRGNPAAGVRPTTVTSDFLNMLQDELLGLLAAAGIAPSKTSRGQVLQAIQTIIQANGATYAADTGAANAMMLTPTPAIAAYTVGLGFRVLVAASNTGGATVNVGGLGVKALKRPDGSPLKRGDLTAGEIAIISYDGTNFQLVDLPQPLTAIPRLVHASQGVVPGTYIVDTTGGVAIVLSLPTVKDPGDTITFFDPNGNWAANNFTIARNGSSIMGQTVEDLVVDLADAEFSITWTGADWRLV